jgi:hypothetical protein
MNPRLASLALTAAVAAILAAPLLVTALPPLVDYPNHLARAVLLHTSAPELRPYYAIEWAILPNLAMDILMGPLLAALEPYTAGRVLLFLILLSNVLAVVAYHRAAFGVFSWWPFAAALVAYNATFLMGFLNFQIGLSVAFAGAAAWIALAPRHRLAALACLAGFGMLAFFCHLVSVVFLFLLVGAEEMAPLLRRHGTQLRGLAREAIPRLAPLCLALLPALLLYALSPLSESTGSRLSFTGFEARPLRLLVPFANYDREHDLLAGLFVFGVVAVLVASRRAVLHPAALLAALLALGLYAVVPHGAATGSWLEIRFPILLGFLLFAGIRPTLGGRASATLALALGALLVLRTSALATEWAQSARFSEEVRKTAAAAPSGARVAAVRARHVGAERQPMPTISFVGQAPYAHLPALLVIERRAFWPGLFAFRGQQPLVLQPPHDALPPFVMGLLPTPSILDATTPQPDPRQSASALRWVEWPERFDHVLVIGAYALPDVAAFDPARLTLVSANRAAALFRVRGSGPGSSGEAELRIVSMPHSPIP